MPHCLSFRSPSSSSQATDNVNPRPPQSQGNSTDGTPRSGSQILSPTVNLSREYIQAVQSSSYNEMWSKIHILDPNDNGEEGHVENGEGQQHLSLEQVLQPDRQCVEKALSLARVNTLTRLVKSYFDHSEKSSSLCIVLYHCLRRARNLYAPLYKLLDILLLDGHISESQCDRAFDIFLDFDLQTNPFHCPDHSQNNFTEMGHCFLQLKHQLNHKLAKSRSRVRLIRNAKTCSAICLIGTVMGVAVSAAVITAHALGLLAAAPLCARCRCPNTPTFTKKELAHVAQLDAAARGTFVLLGELYTMDRLVVLLYDAVEDDRKNVRFALERGRDKHPIQEVLRLLCNNRVKVVEQTRDLEERICLCLNTVNRARDLLLQEVTTHQSGNS